MLECWNENPTKRPSFTKIKNKFDTLLLDGRRDAYIAIQMDHNKPYYNTDLDLEDASHLHPFAKFHYGSQTSLSVQGSPLTRKLSQESSFPRSRSPSISPAHEKVVRSSSMIIDRGEQKQNAYTDDPSRNVTGNTASLTVPKHPAHIPSGGNVQSSSPNQPAVHITVTEEF